ncbi:MAG: site-2 protease family protein [Candidatus Nanopelagicales bacterium]
MLTIVGIIAFVFAILFSIAWHELGHFLPAKKFGVKVTQFMIGFGPTLWSKKKGETEYGVKGIPFGGYVRMIGMFPPGEDGTVRASNTGRIAMLVEDARKEAAQVVLTPEDEKHTFYNLPVRQKLVVMLGGPVMNLILATVLFAIVLVGFGTPSTNLTVKEVSPCVPTASNINGDCVAGAQPSPAAAAGMQVGDVVTTFDGQPVTSWEEFTGLIRNSAAGAATIGVTRDGVSQTLTAPILVVDRPVIVDGQVTNQTKPVGFLGMSPERILQPQPITAVPGQMWDLSVRTGQALISIPSKIVGVAKAAFGSDQRDPNGPIGVVGVTRISGEVAAADLPESWKVAQFLGLVASLNLFLFLFNLIPLLPLDGGHVAGAMWEGIRRRIAKLRHRPDPGPVDVARALPVAYAMAFILIGMSALLLYADVVNPVRIGS